MKNKKFKGTLIIFLFILTAIIFLTLVKNEKTLKVTNREVEDKVGFKGFYFVEEFVLYNGDTKDMNLKYKNGDLVAKNAIISDSISTKNAGMLITHVDGYENKYTRESIKKITAKEIKNILANSEKKPGIKILNNSKWYVCALLNEDDEKYFKLGMSKDVNINNKYYIADVVEVIRTSNSIILVMRFKNDLDVNSLCRAFSGYIVKARYNGITIPEEAIIEYNGVKSVFINFNGYAALRKIKVLSIIDGEAVIIPEKNSKPELAEYDEIILNPKGLEEDKKIR